MTDPERIKRWFMPISGELREGGDFQLEGNAGGGILTCEPPRLLRVTFGGETSIVELRLTPDGDDDTVLELEHTVPLEMAHSGAGALEVGPGWDGALLGLGRYLGGEAVEDPVAAANSPEAQEFSRESVNAWTKTVEASGTATIEESPRRPRSPSHSSLPTRQPHRTSSPATDQAEELAERHVRSHTPNRQGRAGSAVAVTPAPWATTP